MGSQKIIASLDIGTHKVICMIAKITNENRIFIRGIGEQHIENPNSKDELTKAIANSIYFAEQGAGLNINSIVVSANFDDLQTSIVNEKRTYNNKRIKNSDLQEILENVQSTFSQKDKYLIHLVATDYILDGKQVIHFDDTTIGTNFEAYFAAITSNIKSISLIKGYMKKVMLNIDYFITSGYATRLAFLNKDEQELTLILDIGAGFTHISLVFRNKFIYESLIKFAGNTITSDLEQILRTTKKVAEEIKKINTDFTLTKKEEEELIKCNVDDSNYDISKNTRGYINRIVEARLLEIIKLSFAKIESAGYKKIPDKIILAGGVALIPGVENFVSNNFGNINTIVGYVDTRNIMTDESIIPMTNLKNPFYSVSLGMLFYIKNIIDKKKYEKTGSILNFIKKIF
ncbi:MAG: cell division protein FtsA [Rickettsiales bacterium]|nr:MAG: cell division protein FtsA [Rickettsiales bacterium]